MVYRIGFVLNGRDFFPNNGSGHEKNAKSIIEKMGWGKEFDKSNKDSIDFLLFNKGAVQLGSGNSPRVIIYSRLKVSQHTIEEIKINFDLVNYREFAID